MSNGSPYGRGYRSKGTPAFNFVFGTIFTIAGVSVVFEIIKAIVKLIF